MITLHHDDCFNIFPTLEDNSIDLVLCDMPYGTTACKWDTVLDLELMWQHIKRISKDNAAVVLTASQPFTSVLVCSNLMQYRCSWIWEKSSASNFLNAKRVPLNNTEDVIVFSKASANSMSKAPMVYYPQGLITTVKTRVNSTTGGKIGQEGRIGIKKGTTYTQEYSNYPTKIIKFKNEKNTKHPTQKPVSLMEYLVKTYSNEGDIVLDFCMGSGSTGVACKNLNRNFIGIEKEEKYYNISLERINL